MGLSSVNVLRASGRFWRGALARFPLPMLALAASYGVYRFSALFVPDWVAVVQAAAFELVYIGLAVVRLPREQQRRAQAISVRAVVVSVLYNSLDGLFHRRPDVLQQPPLWMDISLALLHGVPLALLAYFVADLLLHHVAVDVESTAQNSAHARVRSAQNSAQNGNGRHEAAVGTVAIRGGRTVEYALPDMLLALDGEDVFSRELVLEQLHCSDATATRLLAEAVQSGCLERLERGVYRRC